MRDGTSQAFRFGGESPFCALSRQDVASDTPEPALREAVANALVKKGVRLAALGRSEEAIALFDELLARFADAPEPTIAQLVEMARKVLKALRFNAR